MSGHPTQKPLRVMLVDDSPERRAMLDQTLREVDCALVACVTTDRDLLSAVQSCRPDVILIDVESPGRDTLESLESVQSNQPRPMVMFAQDDDYETIKRATLSGVSAYVVDGLQVKRVRPIIDAGIARFQQFNRLETELRRTRTQLEQRKLIDKAKGIIMQQRGVNEAAAYGWMRKMAMDSNKKIAEVARRIVEASRLLTG